MPGSCRERFDNGAARTSRDGYGQARFGPIAFRDVTLIPRVGPSIQETPPRPSPFSLIQKNIVDRNDSIGYSRYNLK